MPPPKLYYYKGKYLTLPKIAALTGIRHNTLWYRLKRGWHITQATSASLQVQAPRIVEYLGKKQSLFAWAKELGLNQSLVYRRVVDMKLPIDIALSATQLPRGKGQKPTYKPKLRAL